MHDDDGLKMTSGDKWAAHLARVDLVPETDAFREPTHAEACLSRQSSWNVPPAYRGALVTDFSDADFDPRCGAGWILQSPLVQERSVFLSGPNGSGKSHLAAALVGEWGGRWTTASDIMLQVQSSWRRDAGESEEMIVRDLQKTRILVVDDITAIAKTERGVSVMLAILGGRLDRNLKSIVTSFQGLATIDKIDSSLASRLGGFEQVVLVGRDRRLRRGGKA
jgi:hypothetical protein